MDLWSVSPEAIARAAARKAGVPRWKVGAVSVVSGHYAHARLLGGGAEVVYERDVWLEDALGTSPHYPPRDVSKRENFR